MSPHSFGPGGKWVTLWMFGRRVRGSKGIALDSMGFSYALMVSEWAKIEDHESTLYAMMEGSRHMRLPVQLFELVSRWRGGSALGGPPSLTQVSHPYQKIGMLL